MKLTDGQGKAQTTLVKAQVCECEWTAENERRCIVGGTGTTEAPDKPELLNGSLTTHVLNTATGLPAAGLALRLAQLGGPGGQWMELAQRRTDADGRCLPLLPPGQAEAGTYKLHFETAAYWQGLGYTSFYPFVEVVFTITDPAQKLHVPLLISPYSYTTYRGS
ncbi:5-hydroxyisourate hydrolase-like isoform X1 [Coturnix japonica]|uniref:5-hydroxyisourate hydrolase-like isoform X1 n=1 Tax=Coturnix japonica TaxID=93934 RepID=UPI0013A5BE1D|nr:5-hydroxyisourate hydrolase-like isoform X1 [Coturnix japonica]